MLYIIIGLPASGKTTYHSQYLKDIKLHDDFLNNFFDNELIEDLEKNIDICITDPRMCDFNRFQQYMKTFTSYIDKKNIKLIIYKNDPAKCLINARLRGTKRVERTIQHYATIYNTELFANAGYQYDIIDVSHSPL